MLLRAPQKLGRAAFAPGCKQFHRSTPSLWGGEFYKEEILDRVDVCFQALEDEGHKAFQTKVQESDGPVLHWIASQLMQPHLDTPQAERMLRAMNEITLFSGSRMVGEVERHLHSQSDMDQSIDEGAAQPRARILEIGCGAGQTLVKMASVCKGKKKDWKVLGVDYSVDSITFAKRALDEAGTDNAIYQLQVADISDGLWALPAGGFDVVYHLENWYHWPDLKQGVRETSRVLKSGGLLVTGSRLSPLFDLFGPRFPEVSEHFPVFQHKRGPRAEHRDLEAYEKCLKTHGEMEKIVSEDLIPPGEDRDLEGFTLTTAIKK